MTFKEHVLKNSKILKVLKSDNNEYFIFSQVILEEDKGHVITVTEFDSEPTKETFEEWLLIVLQKQYLVPDLCFVVENIISTQTSSYDELENRLKRKQILYVKSLIERAKGTLFIGDPIESFTEFISKADNIISVSEIKLEWVEEFNCADT